MPATATRPIVDWLDGRDEAMASLLVRLTRAESPSLDARAQRRPLRLLARLLELRWLERAPTGRALRVTDAGRAGLAERFGVLPA